MNVFVDTRIEKNVPVGLLKQYALSDNYQFF